MTLNTHPAPNGVLLDWEGMPVIRVAEGYWRHHHGRWHTPDERMPDGTYWTPGWACYRTPRDTWLAMFGDLLPLPAG